ncbi:PadR family transcriptional regulator [Microbacterium terricola]|uniref:PadR family transcriptional regulator n=2 Tax=Microbacterium terricola TaxID=344163 RepID=A0ABM8DV17_9MICO|nr:PadR family transcriptional regulator [Microbacterium terricola]BDV29452.1 PadR family transcriptional regulator [Microbacterium terricola]
MKDGATALTPLAVVVLGLLRERDMHPYEMMRLIRQRRDDRLVNPTNGTMYHTVGRLERAGLIAEVGVDRDGNRPERTTYAITPAGAAAAEVWVRRELPCIDRILEFRVALAEAHELPREEAIDLLTQRRHALARYRAELRTGLEGAAARGVPFQFLIELEREDAILVADLAWMDGVLRRLPDPDLPWGVHELPADTMARLTAYRESVTS